MNLPFFRKPQPQPELPYKLEPYQPPDNCEGCQYDDDNVCRSPRPIWLAYGHLGYPRYCFSREKHTISLRQAERIAARVLQGAEL